jgi:hypothetical protein
MKRNDHTLSNALLVMFLGVMSTFVHGEVKSLPLAGTWRFALDPNGVGETEKWFTRELTDTITLPGTLAENRKGPRGEPRANVSELSSEYPYEGVAWYQRMIDIPTEWKGCLGELYLERSKITSVWLDDLCIGTNNALGVAQVYPISSPTPGQHRLTVRVDSKAKLPASGGHMVTTSVQTKWNGLLGDLHLVAHDPVWIARLRVVPDVTQRTARVTLFVRNVTGKPQKGKVMLNASLFNVPMTESVPPVTVSQSVAIGTNDSEVTVNLSLGPNAPLWDEFQPALYRLTAVLETDIADGQHFRHTSKSEFGLREFATRGSQFTINGRAVLLRGKHDAMAFPLTGYAAMDVAEWTRVLSVAKSYGINHYRFHTCTPPEAAFQAADRLGIYLQPELYNFGGAYRDGEAGDYNLAEAKRILSAYGNHPSFVMLALGNEIWDGRDIRAKAVAELRAFDSTRLYAQGSNNEFGRPTLATGDDYWTTARTSKDSAAHAVRGSFSHADKPLGHIQQLRSSTTYDYRNAIAGVPVPVLGHEVGQFEVFPNFREIQKYSGVQKPWNLITFRQRLEAAGMLDQADAFVAASGALVVQCYREEIEACLRTPGFGGFQLLDLQDFPGQGTALVGILDAFMESKGLITSEAWRRFCGPVVPLARMESYTWTTAQTFIAKIEVAQYGPKDLSSVMLAWSLIDARGKRVVQGQIPPRNHPQGTLVAAGNISIPLAQLPAPARYELSLSLVGTDIRNDYPLWLYPAKSDTHVPASVTVCEQWDDGTKAMLAEGKTVLLLPATNAVSGVEGFYTPDFWCYPMFRSICEGGKKPVAPGTMGLLIDAKHPALAAFPTASFSEWQWWDLVTDSRAVILDATPAAYRPVVQVIDNFERNHKLGVLFEARVGSGRLLVCTLDLLHKQESPVARQLLHSLLQYAKASPASGDALPVETLDVVFKAQPAKKKNQDTSFKEFFDRKEK